MSQVFPCIVKCMLVKVRVIQEQSPQSNKCKFMNGRQQWLKISKDYATATDDDDDGNDDYDGDDDTGMLWGYFQN